MNEATQELEVRKLKVELDKLKGEVDNLGLDRAKARADYLVDQYGYYTSHMNQVFNFYLVAAALVASAFVQSLSGPNPLETPGSQTIAVGGALASLVFWALHMRGFQIADALDHELKSTERQIGSRFMKRRKRSQAFVVLFAWALPRSCAKHYLRRPRSTSFLLRNGVLFSLIYIGFIGGFSIAACNVEGWRSERSRALQISVSQSVENAPPDAQRAGAAREANPRSSAVAPDAVDVTQPVGPE